VKTDRMLAYDAAHALARMALERDRNVVLECTYARAEQRASLVKALDRLDPPLWVAEFAITPEDAVRRFRRRDQAMDLDEDTIRERVRAFPYSDPAFGLEAPASAPADLGQVDQTLDAPRSQSRLPNGLG